MYKYTGCYINSSPVTDLDEQVYTSSASASVDNCAFECHVRNKPVVGVQASEQCCNEFPL